ncbi:hypothetical protein BDP27DRAFT_1421634 [Rhodocollybia butyracea]|uniref:Uncharacterized protein n=1 Tax=Rhodocollybia butyracea TaxID=206335 RepID=A0A9P5PSZ2_9AGAR|nr:hypothetical protein BDP27DRAFT_1421634 [Rhodocollybia butyracea]
MSTLLPVALELLLYGIFLSVFGLSIYVFRRKFMPGKLYIMPIVLFFLLTTCSVALDLLAKRNALFDYIRSLPIGVDNQLLLGHSEMFIVELGVGLTAIFFITRKDTQSALDDLILMYRCYCLWNGRKIVMLLPALCIFANLARGLLLQSGAQSRGEDSIFFAIYVFAEITVGLILTVLLASRLWWLNRQTEKLLGKSSGSTLGNLVKIFLESGLLLPTFLGVALALNIATSPFSEDLVDKALTGSQILSICALTQVAAIASTLILVRIGLGVDVQPSEGPRYTYMDNASAKSLALDLERGIMNVDVSSPMTVHPFSLKYESVPSGSVTSKPADRRDTIWSFSLKHRRPSFPEPGHIIGRLIRPFYIPSETQNQTPSGVADAHPISNNHESLEFESELPRYEALNELALT